MGRDCPACGASCAESTKVCGYCGAWLVAPESAEEELAILREMQRLSQHLEHGDLNRFWQGAPLMTKPEAMLQDVIQSMARLKPGSEAWDLNSFDGELNKITKQRIETLFLSLKMESHPDVAKKVAMLEAEYNKRAAKAGCFPGRALVWTPSGPRPICQFAPGDRVLSYNLETGGLEVEAVTALRQYGAGRLRRLALDNGSVVHTTDSHTFRTPTGWTVARDLTPGDVIAHVHASGQLQEATLLESQESPEITDRYNLHTTGAHSFIVEGFIAHNFTHLRGLRTWLHRLAIDPVFHGRQRFAMARARLLTR